MKTIRKLFMVIAGLLPALSTQAQIKVSGNTNDVGEIPIQYALSPSGAVTYQVPMDVHPVPDQFQPQLSFSYSSQQGESSIGYGWNIGGLSAITHVAGNIYYDGSASSLSLSGDKFMLDGVRLIKTGTDAWQTEQGLVKVKKQADGKMEARYPNGNVATFETSANAPFSYVLTSYTNMQGRSIKCVYSQADNLPYIRKVMYGENNSDSIVFSYRNVTDGIVRYVDGKAVRNNRLLDKVESYYCGQLWRRYRLTYEKKEVNQLVKLDCETENHALNPLRFEYGDERNIESFSRKQVDLNYAFNNYEEANADEQMTGYNCLTLSRGRFSYSSHSDGLVSYPQLNSYTVTGMDNNENLRYGSSYNENQKLLVYKELSSDKASPVIFTAGKGFQQMTPADINGLGVDALVKVNYYLNISNGAPKDTKERLIVAVHDDVDPNSHKDYTYEGDRYVTHNGVLSPRQREFLFGDFNGDGKTELLAISSCRNHAFRNLKDPSHALLVDLQNRKTLFDGNSFDYAYFQESPENDVPDRLIAMDYNGDGKTDICLINMNGTSVYEFTGTGFKQLAYIDATNGGISSSAFEDMDNSQELLVADINGDGNMDLILAPKKSNYDASTANETSQEKKDRTTWRFLLSTGNSSYRGGIDGFTSSSRVYLRRYAETAGRSFMLVDVDNDGLPDLLSNVRGKVDLYLNKNGKLSDVANVYASQTLRNQKAQFAIANITQSYYWSGGLICVDNGDLYIYDYTRKENMERMIHNVTNSCGVKSNHVYVDIMTTVEDRYEEGNGNFGLKYLNYPYNVMTPHYYVSAWTKRMSGFDVLSWELYKYRNAVFHRTGLGFRGFQQIQTEDVINSRKIVSTIDPTLMGVEIKRETPTDIINRQYVMDVNSNKISLLKLTKESDKNILNETETITNYQYNSYGQLTRSKLSYGTLSKEETYYEYQNIDNGTKYLLGLPTSSTVDKFRGDSVITRATTIEYNADYLPSHKTSLVNGLKIQEERFTYNGNMRLDSHKQRSCESTDWLETTYTYDAQGNVSRETDAMGLYTDYKYDSKTGFVLSATDQKGRTIRNEYDEWGNQQIIHYPDGRVKKTSVAWCAGAEPGLYVTTVTETGKPIAKTYFDLLGREVRNSQIRFNGKEMKTDKKYNANTGLLEQVSQPTTDAQPTRWNQYTYDKYDRPISIRYASGKTDLHAYGVLTDTIVENGIRHIRKYDETGMMTQASDAAGSIQYYYRPDGSPLSVIAPGGVQTRLYYDERNRRIAIKDPSAGIRRTEYNAAGNVSREIDADGREIKKEYDRYGRVTKQITPDLETIYTYDNTENLLSSAVSNNGTAFRYTYDDKGRVSTWKEETPDGKWLKKEYTYTSGVPSSVVYTSATGILATENMTYLNGYLTEIRLSDGTLVYRHDEENALGQLTKLTTGSMQRSYTFNEWGLPTKRTITRANGSVMFNHSYVFNINNSNLESRKDEVRGLTEAFTYDNLNRLSTYGGLRINYNDNGNILSKDDIGTLAYTNLNRPYATTGLDPISGKQVPTGLDITYTAAQRPSVITQGTKRATLTYNSDHDRVRMQLSDAGVVSLTRYYIGDNYEIDESLGNVKEKLYLGGGYYDAPAVLIKQGGNSSVYFINRDYLGSILQIADAQGNVVEENSFDAWGQRRNPVNRTVYAVGTEPELMLGRGFTGHEHLSFFGLINMNARLYDPVLGRFLSPDPYVQILDFTQNYNRYAYVINNPLKYIDQSGEWFGFDDLIIAGAGFIFGYVAHGISTGNWGGKALAAGAMGAGAAWLGYNTAGLASGSITSTTWNQVGGMAINAMANQIMPPVYIPIGDHFGIGLSIGFGFGTTGLTGGVNMTGTYTNGDFSISAGIGAGDNYWGWSAATTYDGYGGGYGQTSYGKSEVMGQSFGAQRVGTFTGYFNYNSFSLSNDLFGDGEDRWRTSAAELTIGKWSIGTYVNTNWGMTESNKLTTEISAPLLGKNESQAWTNGRAYYSPLWIGYKNRNQVIRAGFSHPMVQNLTQNAVHKYMTPTPYFLNYDEFITGGYFYSGYRNPHSLW